MPKHNPATVSGLPCGAMERLALFAEWTGTTPRQHLAGGEVATADLEGIGEPL